MEPKYQAMKYDVREQGGANTYNDLQKRKRSRSLETGLLSVTHLNADVNVHKDHGITVKENNFITFFYTAFMVANVTPGFRVIAHRNIHIIDPIHGQFGNFAHDKNNNNNNNNNNSDEKDSSVADMSLIDDITVSSEIASNNNNNNIDNTSHTRNATGKLDPRLIGKFGEIRKSNTSVYKEIIIDQRDKNSPTPINTVSINTHEIGVGTDIENINDNSNVGNINIKDNRTQYEIAYIEVRKIYTSNAKPLLFDMYVRNKDNQKEIFKSCSFIMKKGDDLRKDCGILYMFRFFNELWNNNDLNLKYHGFTVNALTYKCIAMGYGGANNIINFADNGNGNNMNGNNSNDNNNNNNNSFNDVNSNEYLQFDYDYFAKLTASIDDVDLTNWNNYNFDEFESLNIKIGRSNSNYSVSNNNNNNNNTNKSNSF